MSKCFCSVSDIKNFLGHGYNEKAYEEIYQAYEQGLIDDINIYQIKEELNNG